jgi:hypothetical protein
MISTWCSWRSWGHGPIYRFERVRDDGVVAVEYEPADSVGELAERSTGRSAMAVGEAGDAGATVSWTPVRRVG